MRRFPYIIVSALCLSLPLYATHDLQNSPTLQKQGTFVLASSAPSSFIFYDLCLETEASSLAQSLEVSAMCIERDSLPRFPNAISDISGVYAHGYRLLPSGNHFLTPVRLTLGYNPTALPAGYTPYNIYTFYYDEVARCWQRLERVAVDTLQHTVTSLTTHFTDFANAVILIPEPDEPESFVPTSARDIPSPVHYMVFP